MIDGIFRESKENRFFIEGEGNVKYKFHNATIANDPKLAVTYFIRALETMPSLIENYEKENRKLSMDIPVLEEIAQSTWRKESELKELKSELAAVDRKIQLSLKPIDQTESPQPPSEIAPTYRGDLVSEIDEKGQKNGHAQNHNPFANSERMKEYKEVMGDRLMVVGVPKMGEEKIREVKM